MNMILHRSGCKLQDNSKLAFDQNSREKKHQLIEELFEKKEKNGRSLVKRTYHNIMIKKTLNLLALFQINSVTSSSNQEILHH